eukprot:CAMPEP_0176075336 /NCGR_PEP_ID=MMETSP0120_2-20121206/37654_1 /TAXON_ID=160619 /ORGANISM="Kryptoperidinium foliaceum, Strain CCMP 1326" /LENGTH=306 /DNA_ID=CAMNT_0017409041 /DNA_START=77 /DNA_END=997 /DNA_ORIENTATION=+
MKHVCCVALAAGAFLSEAVAAHGGLRAQTAALKVSEEPAPSSCGGAPEYENSKPKNFEDARKTFFNPETKKEEPVTFKSGDVIDFKCEAGFTIDGSKDGETTYKVECSEHGYFKPAGVCMKASKCGAVPEIPHAAPTGKMVSGKAEFACAQGYSLDGQKVLAGGFGKNRFFTLKCQEFSGKYEDFSGECKPYAFVPASETVRIYNQVSEALFIASCKGTLKVAFSKGETPALANVCSSFEESSGACAGLVSKIKGDFAAKMAERKAFDDKEDKEWHEEKGEGRPGIGEEAQTFCTELWKLLEMPDL